MMAFLTTLFTNCHQANVHLAVFLNGSLEASRFKDWVKNQMAIKSNVNQVLKHLTKRMTPPPKVFWVPPCSLRLILRLAIRSLNATVINRYLVLIIDFFSQYTYLKISRIFFSNYYIYFSFILVLKITIMKPWHFVGRMVFMELCQTMANSLCSIHLSIFLLMKLSCHSNMI